jgi:hypothetical protein
MLDRDLVVGARCIQEPLEVVPGWCRLVMIALGARRLALHPRHEVVVTTALVVLLLLLKHEDVPSSWSTTCFPLP